MKGRLYIDGVDIWSEFKVAITDGGYNGLISAPNLKPIDYIDWLEEDGIEADLSNPVLDTKEFDITFGNTDNALTENFLAFLSETSYADFELIEIDTRRTLRLVSQPNKETIQTAESFTLRFADDFPLNEYNYLPPINSINQIGYNIDDKPLSAYGILVLDGSDDEIMKAPAVKKNLIQNHKYSDGVIYDDSLVKYQHKDVALKCLLLAPNVTTFWHNYNALIYDLTRPDERLFYVERFNDTFSCFYKSCQVSRFSLIGQQVWCEFALTLVFTDFRPKANISVLGTEDNRIVISEDLSQAFLIKDYLPAIHVLGTEDWNIITTEDLEKTLKTY